MAEQVLLAIGDACGRPDSNPGAAGVAALATQLVAADPTALILLLGDNAYDSGSHDEYTNHYMPLLGIEEFNGRIRACPGNHDYRTAGAREYFATLGPAAAGMPDKSYYSFDVDAGWHIVSLNSEVEQDEHSPQLAFLAEDLAQRRHPPILAFWHRPRWGSGGHRDSTKPRWFWKQLFAHRAEIVLNGHAHHYERFDQQRPDQIADPNGIREFIVGTGGRKLSRKTKDTPNSRFTDFIHHGLLKLTLTADQYRWEFIAVDGAILDQGQTATNR
jgi:acid phosphatase type 7